MLHSEEQEEMKKNLEPRKEFFLLGIQIIDGIQKIKNLNYGIYLIQKYQLMKV